MPLVVPALLAASCGDGLPPLRTTPPTAPTASDPAFTVAARRWLLRGDGLSADAPYDITVTAPAGVRVIDAWIDGGAGTRILAGSDGSFHALVPAPVAGEHLVSLAADGAPVAFDVRPLHVSAALYTIVSTDWDDSDNKDVFLHNIDSLRAAHPGLLLSQFFGPYVLTDTTTTQARKDVNVGWLKHQKERFGDEIGVHIHPYCNFVETVILDGKPIPCRTQPSGVSPAGDPTGYTVLFASYTVDEQAALLQGAAELLAKNGLGRPTSFRAGGWEATGDTVAACDRAGYTVESSAFPPQTIQSAWPGTILASWTLEHWGHITTTSQPYHPSMSDVQSPVPGPAYAALEVPDNGCLVDYMAARDMLAVLDANFPAGAPLTAPRVFQIGLHPPDFSGGYLLRMQQALDEVQKHRYADDNGPIVYARLSDLTSVSGWAQR